MCVLERNGPDRVRRPRLRDHRRLADAPRQSASRSLAAGTPLGHVLSARIGAMEARVLARSATPIRAAGWGARASGRGAGPGPRRVDRAVEVGVGWAAHSRRAAAHALRPRDAAEAARALVAGLLGGVLTSGEAVIQRRTTAGEKTAEEDDGGFGGQGGGLRSPGS